jgi:hypothetical protein
VVLQVHGVGVGREDLGVLEDLLYLDLAANGLSPPSSSGAAVVSSMYAPRAPELAFS